MKQKITLFLFALAAVFSTAKAAGIPVCLTNSYGEQASLVATKTSPGQYSVSGQYDYRPFGSTLWPVSGTYNATTHQLHFVATNPSPDNCTFFANTVTFDYTVSGTNLSGSFSNDCGNAGSLTASGVRGSCGFSALKLKQDESGSTGSHKMQRSPLPVPPGEDLQKLLSDKTISDQVVAAAGIPVCLTNSYGEQASLVATKTSPGQYSVSGQYDYRPFGSTLWPVSGTYNATTHQLHFVATNPSPDNCTFFANTVTFDYTVSGTNLSGSFSNDCGNAGSLTASGVRGSCGFAALKLKQGESGSTGSHKMQRSPLPVPPGEDLQKLLSDKTISDQVVAAAGIPVCLTNSYGEQASLVATKTSPGQYVITGQYDYRPFGSTLWPVTGTYVASTKHLHFVATNPNPDNCTQFANTVTFDYTLSGTSLSGNFSNDCGNAGSLTASGVRGSCGFSALKLKQGESGSTGSHKMQRTPVPVPPGEDLQKLLAEKVISVSPNPAVNSVQISFTINGKSRVDLRIYDQNGNLTRTLVSATLDAGKHTYTWNLKTEAGKDAPRGFYWLRATTNEGEMSQRMLIAR